MIKSYSGSIYNKSGLLLGNTFGMDVIATQNYGYNLLPYLKFIIDNYFNLPARVAFIKSNIFPRHVDRFLFANLIKSHESFVPLADQRGWAGVRWPQSFCSGDNLLCELNNSWYRFKHQRHYFVNYNEFYKTFFDYEFTGIPRYLRFAPGANYIVSLERIMRCSQIYYRNLESILSGSPFACECHYLERSLAMLWDSRIPLSRKSESMALDLTELALKCKSALRRDSKILHQAKSATIKAVGFLADIGSNFNSI